MIAGLVIGCIIGGLLGFVIGCVTVLFGYRLYLKALEASD